ncbi:PucR family transcriptional regulator [Streptomyces sp. NPDC001985]|uniref:PucR family transcriptional regulator n=1 Tax=Streptomyces sp. NPDC001985 TaxID=3154406 RepID=UPI0033198D32
MPDATALPPTPPVPLTALLAHEELGLRQIAGPRAAEAGTGAAVHWVHTSEMADPYPYLLGGELLLSAGVLLADPELYVRRITAARAAALGFGVAPVHDTVPAGLIEACDRYGLPLLEVPPRTTFTAVARAVWRLMAEERHRELRRVTRAQQGLATAAARPDPVPAVLAQLAAHLGGRAVLLSRAGAELATAGRAPGPAARAALLALARVVSPAREASSAPEAAPGRESGPAPGSPGARATGLPAQGSAGGPGAERARRAAPPHTSPGRPGREGGPEAGSAPAPGTPGGGTPPDGTRPGSGPAAGAPAARAPGSGGEARHAPGRGSTGPVPASASDTVDGVHLSAYALAGGEGLVLGLASPGREAGDHTVAGVAVVLLSLLTAEHQGLDSAGRGAALVRLMLGAGAVEAARLLGSERWTVVHARGGGPAPLAAPALGAALGSALVDTGEDGTVRVLLPSPAAPEPAARPGWVLGVSDPVEAEHLAAADAQAAQALRRALATGRGLVRHRGTGPAALLTWQEASAHARLRLAPLTGSPALVETLRGWLSLHGSWDRTAAALGVHRNTVRQRVARCAALLAEDLDDADVRMELWFALRSLP